MVRQVESTVLQNLVAGVQTALQHVDVARSRVTDDKQERAGSLMARVVDALTTTQPEAALNDAETRLTAVTEKARTEALAWIVSTARRNLAERSAEADAHQDLARKLERLLSRAGQARRWLELAQAADRLLSAAHKACESASTTELLDFVSTSKVISTLSYLDTSSAAEAVKRAGLAAQALAEALPKRAGHVSIDEPDDLLDFVVDITFDPSFDLLSLLNMGQLDDAARECEQAANKLRPLLERLGKLVSDVEANESQVKAALLAIETPYLEAATAQVPELLRASTPVSFAT